MNLLTVDQRDQASSHLGFTPAADGDAVLRAITDIRHADRHCTNPLAVSRALAGALTAIRRLLDVEAEHTATRTTIARLVIANNRGDDYSLSDLAWQLQEAGVDLKAEYAHADALAEGAESEGIL
jgi:hypothetical protein